jgi:uncharacterized membrane protein YtjA (UPF0391 family)
MSITYKRSMFFWGMITVAFTLIIGISGMTGAQGNYLVSVAKICIWPALIMFAVSLSLVLRGKNQ